MNEQPTYYVADDAYGTPAIWRQANPPVPILTRIDRTAEAFDLLAHYLEEDQAP